MPRRVLHILGGSGHEGTGLARIVLALHRYIDPTKYELSACFVGPDGPLIRDFQEHGIPTHVIPWRHPSRDLAGLLWLLRYLRAEKLDIIHFHWGGPRIRQLTTAMTGAKRILHLHSSIDESSGHAVASAHADCVIAVSRAVAQASKHSCIRVIYPGVLPANPQPAKKDLLIIGSAGRLTPLKGIFYLLQGMALLHGSNAGLRLQIAGDGAHRGELQAHAARLGLTDSVDFLGWLERVPWNKWSTFVQPSLEEGLPMAVLEAMSAGVPVIASRVGGLPEVIEHERTGLLVPPADAQALASAIRRLALDSAMRDELRAAGSVRIKENFTAQKMAAEIAALYDELLAK